jgi:S-adenosylmethionine hydrolase
MTQETQSPRRPTVAILTDFGLAGVYAGAVKGVIRSIGPEIDIIDVTHQVPARSILLGATFLSQAAPYYPEGTVFMAVVDPGVGTERRAIIAVTGGKTYVAPDNGLLTFVLEDDARIFSVDNRDYALERISQTFHGRDIFAPAAAHLARGVKPEAFGAPIDNPILLPWPDPKPLGPGRWELSIIAADRFGNLITALRPEHLSTLGLTDISVRIGERRIGMVSPTFGAVDEGRWLAYWGGGGLLEVGINGGNASAASGLGADDTVELVDPARSHDDEARRESPA